MAARECRSLAVVILLLGAPLAGCFEAELREDVYACTPGDPSTCPEGWFCRMSDEAGEHRCFRTDDPVGPCGPDNCSGCCSREDQCLAGIADTACGMGGAACTNCTQQGGFCDQGACSACQCTAGECCDGCHFKPQTERCNEVAVDQAFRCSSAECGAAVETRRLYPLCPGNSESCDGDFDEWSDWEVVQQCAGNELCEQGTVEAYCVPCPGDCAAGACQCYDPDDDGFGPYCENDGDCDPADGNVYPGAPEIKANCIDENCDGVDPDEYQGVSYTFDPPSGTAHGSVNLYVVLDYQISSGNGFANICLHVTGPGGFEDSFDSPEVLDDTEPDYRWRWHIHLLSPGTYRLTVWTDWDGPIPCNPMDHLKVLCREYEVL